MNIDFKKVFKSKPARWIYAGVILLFLVPIMLLAMGFSSFWEWWHFGPSQRILNFARGLGCDKELLKSVCNKKEISDWVNKA